MKKWIVFGLMLLMGVRPIYADVLVEPEDDFYKDHISEIEAGRKTAVTLKGITLYRSPDSSEILGNIPEGETITLDFKYVNSETGEIWYIHNLYGEYGRFVYLKSDGLEIQYDLSDFYDDYSQQIVQEESTIQIDETEGYIVMWSYPNSNQVDYFLDVWYAHGNRTIDTYRYYIDENDVKWYDACASNAHACGWINSDEVVTQTAMNYPTSVFWGRPEDAVIETTPEATVEPTPDPVADAVQQHQNHTQLIGILVISVCVMTGILIKMLHKKK